MIDHRIRPLIDPLLSRMGGVLVGWGVGPNSVTLAGFAIGMGAAVSIATQYYVLGLVMLLASRLADGLDGAVARESGRVSDRGGFLDIVLDFIFYASIPFAFAVADPGANALAATFLIWSFIGTSASFLSYAIIAEKRGLSTNARGQKSLFYLGGLTEGFETIVVLAAMCLFPQYFALLAWVFAALAWITTATRLYLGWVNFR